MFAGAILLLLPAGKLTTFGGSFMVDDFARFLKILALLGSAAAIAMSLDYVERERQQRFEYSVLILLSTLGMMMLISAADLIALYLGLELMSLPLYVVAASHRDNLRSTEAGLKYFVLGALSSGMLLYGASLTYGFTGTVSFAGIAHAAGQGGPASIGLIFGIVFLFAGFCFKVSAVPFHMWTPDVYEGAPTPVTAFFAAAPKVAGIAMFVRVAVMAFPGITSEWQQIVVFVSIASMVLGAFAAIGQRNIKRLMAYSSIGHMGFALIGLAAGTSEGVQGVLIYMAIYITMTLGVFAVILSMRRDAGMVGIDRSSRPAWRAPIRRRRSFWRCCCSRWRAFRRSPASSPNSTSSSPPSKPAFMCWPSSACWRAWSGAYYYLASSRPCISTSRSKAFTTCRMSLRVVLAVCGPVQYSVLSLSGAAGRRRERGRAISVLMQLDPDSGRGGRAADRPRHGRLDQRGSPLRAQRGEPGPLWITADEPDRRPRPDGPLLGLAVGNLYASLLAARAVAVRTRAGTSLSLRLWRCATPSCRGAGAGAAARLKWPNDLLLAGENAPAS